MSLTIQQIITDAKRLAGRLKERDSVADILLNEALVINKKIDAMKQVCLYNILLLFSLFLSKIFFCSLIISCIYLLWHKSFIQVKHIV